MTIHVTQLSWYLFSHITTLPIDYASTWYTKIITQKYLHLRSKKKGDHINWSNFSITLRVSCLHPVLYAPHCRWVDHLYLRHDVHLKPKHPNVKKRCNSTSYEFTFCKKKKKCEICSTPKQRGWIAYREFEDDHSHVDGRYAIWFQEGYLRADHAHREPY